MVLSTGLDQTLNIAVVRVVGVDDDLDACTGDGQTAYAIAVYLEWTCQSLELGRSPVGVVQ